MFMKIKFAHNLQDIINLENLLEAWRGFTRGKKTKADVQKFNFNLIRNILALHEELINKKYKHGDYKVFNICDPKPRKIHKAEVRDRIVHHAINRALYPFFNKTFVSDSYSCRNNKGPHSASNRLYDFSYKVSKNNTKTCWILKCDIKKFFANVNHQILIGILKEYINDNNIIWLLCEILSSFQSRSGVGLPLGNLTSQLFANIYMNKFDQFMKHKLKVKYYIRYTDDFVILSDDRDWLIKQIPKIRLFLEKNLKLNIHPNKLLIKSLASGIDFLGWVNFSKHKTLRLATKRKMFKRISNHPSSETINSYLGLLSHGNGFKLKQKILAITRTTRI